MFLIFIIMNKEELQKGIETKIKELDVLKSKILAEAKKDQKEKFENQKKKLEEEISALQKQLDDSTIQITKETQALKNDVEVNNDRSYEIIKDSKMYDKLKEIGKTETEIKEFAENIDKVVRKYLDQELEWFPNSIKNSMTVGIQFAMMETLVKQWAKWSAEFFTAFSATKSGSATKSFEWLYKAFGKVWSVNEFFILANKVQNLTWYLADKKNIIVASKNIPELINPNKFKELLSKPVRSNQAQIDKLDITTLLTLNSKDPVDIHQWEEDLKKIVNNDKIAGVITPETISSIQKSLVTADKLLNDRWKFKEKASDMIDKIASVLDINIPFFGNLGELAGMKFPTDILWERKDGWVLNFVLWVLGYRWGLKWLHREYIREKLDELHINNAFVAAAYSAYQKNINATITNDSDSGTWKVCGLSAPDTTTETSIKAKIPADYPGLKKSIIDSLDTTPLNPIMVAKFAPELITTDNNKDNVDISKITDKDAFADTYLKYIIPLLANTSDNFITSKNVDKDSFALAVMGGLVGDKYFIEWVNIWLISTMEYKSATTATDVADTWNLNVVNGKIDFSKWNFNPEQTKNINLLIDEMNKNNITDINTQIGILSVINKESWFVPKSELSYSNTSNDDIRKIFGSRLLKFSDPELTTLKKDDKKFFDAVYGKDATSALWRNTGNTEIGDGYTYRGRGYNGITFKALYKKYGDIIGEDLVANPDKLNDPIITSKATLAFFKEWNQGKDISTMKFTTKEEAAKTFARINAGNINRSATFENKAIVASANFQVKDNKA